MSAVESIQSAGAYNLAERLGFNGVVATYKGFHRDSQMAAAVVVADRSQIANPSAWSRFCQEADPLRHLPASRLVQPLDFGESPEFYWCAYQWMAGRHLGHEIRELGLPTAGSSLRIVAECVQALRVLHESGAPHRVITPASIFINELKQASLLHAAWGGLILGVTDGAVNPAFMSNLPFLAPEVAAGAEGDEGCDIFALGSNLYFMLTGQPTFWTDDPQALVEMIVRDPIDFSPLRQCVAPDVAQIVEEMLERDPDSRPVNLEALHERLVWLSEQEFAREQAAPQQSAAAAAPVPASATENPTLTASTVAADYSSHQYEEEHHVPAHYVEPLEMPKGSISVPPPVDPSMDEKPLIPEYKAPRDKYLGIILALGGVAIVGVLLVVGVMLIVMSMRKPSDSGGLPPAQREELVRQAVQQGQANIDSTSERLRAAATAFAQYRNQYGRPPLAIVQLTDLGIEEGMLNDAWGTPFEVRGDARSGFYLTAAGPDRSHATDGDNLWIEVQTGELGGNLTAAAPVTRSTAP